MLAYAHRRHALVSTQNNFTCEDDIDFILSNDACNDQRSCVRVCVRVRVCVAWNINDEEWHAKRSENNGMKT